MKTIIAVVGSLGVGKSTLVEQIQKRFSKAIYLSEPVNIWLGLRDAQTGENLLDRFYHNKTRWTYTFENLAFITRLTILIEALNRDDSDIIIIDGSLATDQNVYAQMLHDQGHMDSLEWQAYHLWSQFCDSIIRQHNIHYLYLQCDPFTVKERVISRHREGEQDIDIEYLKLLQIYLERWVAQHQQSVTTLDFSCNINSPLYESLLTTTCDLIHRWTQS